MTNGKWINNALKHDHKCKRQFSCIIFSLVTCTFIKCRDQLEMRDGERMAQVMCTKCQYDYQAVNFIWCCYVVKFASSMLQSYLMCNAQVIKKKKKKNFFAFFFIIHQTTSLITSQNTSLSIRVKDWGKWCQVNREGKKGKRRTAQRQKTKHALYMTVWPTPDRKEETIHSPMCSLILASTIPHDMCIMPQRGWKGLNKLNMNVWCTTVVVVLAQVHHCSSAGTCTRSKCTLLFG